MNMIEVIKEKTCWLIGAVLITIPLLACYPILRLLGLSAIIASIATVCLSGVAYLLLVLYVKPFLLRTLPFTRPKAPTQFLMDGLKQVATSLQVEKGPSYTSTTNWEFDSSNTYRVREHNSNWIYS